MEFDTTVIIDNLDAVLLGLKWTLMMVAGSLALGTVLGLATCFAKLMGKGPLHWLAVGYIELYRTLPEMVNLFWMYYCLPLILGIRMSSVAVGLIAQTLLAGAFLAEIFRAGINAVPDGQVEAAYACGIPRIWIWRAIILPQAVRMMVPAFIAFLSDLFKVSGLLAAISVTELVYQATILSNVSWKYFEFFTVIGLLYFAIIAPLSLTAQHLERKQIQARR